MLKRYIDIKPDDDTTIFISFLGTFDYKHYNFGSLLRFSYYNNHPLGDEVEALLEADTESFNNDLIILNNKLRYHPKSGSGQGWIIETTDLYWCYESELMELITPKCLNAPSLYV